MQHTPSLSRYAHGPDCVVVMNGEFDLSWAAAMQAELDSVIASLEPRQRILVDLTQVSFLDSTALGVLVGAHKSADDAGGSLAMFGATAGVQRLLEITNMGSLMKIYDDLDQAGADAQGESGDSSGR